jgi:hypothetical protein
MLINGVASFPVTELISSLKDTPLPILLILAGLFFLLLSVAAKVGGAIEVSPTQQKIAIPIGLSLLSLGIILNFQSPKLADNISTPGTQEKPSKCGQFIGIGNDLNWKIVGPNGIINAGTLEIISVNAVAKEWEAEQITQTKGNKKVFLRGTFSDAMISLNRGDSEKWIGECKDDRITGKIKTTYSSDMEFEIQ